MSRYIPMPAYYDDMPVDISFVFENEKPAGKHGFLKADGENFRFEDGTLGRFWGVCINGGANFPSHDYAEKFARRLAMTGVNLVRFHQLDAEWDNPNLYAFAKGKRVTSMSEFDSVSMERLDYLIYCLKKEGIYMLLDMISYAQFKEGDNVPEYETLRQEGRPWVMINRQLIEATKRFMKNLWEHYNPYTGLCYKDDPAFVFTNILNECDLFDDNETKHVDYVETPYYLNEYRQLFKKWLEEKGIEYDWENSPFYEKEGPSVDFKIELTKNYYKEMIAFLRGIGVKTPITGTNMVPFGHAYEYANEVVDYCDQHQYFYDWRWGNNERICKNRTISGAAITFQGTARRALVGKPFFASEWDATWPNSYRAEGALYLAALHALQGWSGATIHTYAYTSDKLRYMQVLGRELSTPVGGVPYREGVFTVWNDPAIFGLFYHAALITRRGDVSPAKKRVAVVPAQLNAAPMQAWKTLMEQHHCRLALDNELPEGYDEVILDTDAVEPLVPGRITSDTGEMWRIPSQERGAIDTPMTKVVYGMLGRGAKGASHQKPKNTGISITGMDVTCYTDFAVIAMSSLTDKPIEDSDNVLITTVGRARNTDMMFDGEKMIDVGKPPILVEVIEADVRLKVNNPKGLKIWGVNAEGFYSGRVLTTYEDGYLCFSLGDENNPAVYYLMVRD